MKFETACLATATSASVLGGNIVEGLQQTKQERPLLNVTDLKKKIYSGRVYQHFNFLSEEQVQTALADLRQLEEKGKFETKGLSNTVLQEQGFSNKLDRSIAAVPWFTKGLNGTDRREIPSRIRDLQRTLSEALDRPTMMDVSLNHECYFSKSEVGSRLPRHMDERHEELKGAKGWMVQSRRSLSWLIYLSDPAGWDLEKNGGALRSFPQQSVVESDSTHNGNLQIGWLVPAATAADGPSRAIYLDCWFPVRGVVADGTVAAPHCIIYALDDDDKVVYLTRPWLTENLHGMSTWEFLLSCARHDSAVPAAEKTVLFLDPLFARDFTALEDRSAWDDGKEPRGSEAVDILPQRGSLVVFDSVKLPHQVQLINDGTRLALAGWFHERTQEFPDVFYGSS